jgi:hypothetical protein
MKHLIIVVAMALSGCAAMPDEGADTESLRADAGFVRLGLDPRDPNAIVPLRLRELFRR